MWPHMALFEQVKEGGSESKRAISSSLHTENWWHSQTRGAPGVGFEKLEKHFLPIPSSSSPYTLYREDGTFCLQELRDKETIITVIINITMSIIILNASYMECRRSAIQRMKMILSRCERTTLTFLWQAWWQLRIPTTSNILFHKMSKCRIPRTSKILFRKIQNTGPEYLPNNKM